MATGFRRITWRWRGSRRGGRCFFGTRGKGGTRRSTTVRELLMVRGVTRDLLLGKDLHQNGSLEAASEDGRESETSSSADSGWGSMLTVDSTVNNVNASGEDRINVQQAAEGALTTVKGITQEIAKAIVAYRGQNQLQSLADLLDVTSAQDQNQSRGGRGYTATPGQNQSAGSAQSGNASGPNASGPKVISQNLLMEIADDVTVEQGTEQAGVVNINTASLDGLTCLPCMTKDLAQRVISYRQSNGYFPNVAWLFKVQGMTQEIFKQVAPRVEGRSETYRIL